MNNFLEEKYLIALSNFANTYIEHTKGSIAYKIIRNDIQNYVEYLQEQLQQKEDIINKARELLIKWGEEPDADMYLQMKEYKEHKKLLEILDNKGDK